jgi:hypothetical protein
MNVIVNSMVAIKDVSTTTPMRSSYMITVFLFIDIFRCKNRKSAYPRISNEAGASTMPSWSTVRGEMGPCRDKSPCVTHNDVRAAEVPPNAIAMCTQAKNVRSLPRYDRGSIFIGSFRGRLLRRTALAVAAGNGTRPCCGVSSTPASSTAIPRL